MKPFVWNESKNEWLKKTRGISFEIIETYVLSGHLLEILKHPNSAKYPEQQVFVVNVEGYAYSVPYVETEDAIFLETAIPSRKLTKRYLGSDNQ